MAADYFNDQPNPAPSSDPAVEEREDEAGDSNVALLPTSFFPGDKDLKPGSECKIRVEEIQEGQAVVSYVRDEEQEAAPEPAPEAMPAGPMMDEQMAGFMA